MMNAEEADLRESAVIYSPSCLGNEAIKDLVILVNNVYDVAEASMWNQKGVRTTFTEIESLII